MRAGTDSRQFNRLFTLEKPVGEPDASGHVDLTKASNWQRSGDYWLKLYGQSSREFYRAQQVQSDVTHVADVLYSKVTAEINTSMRWNDGRRVFQITAAFDPEDNHEVIQMRLVQQT